MENGNSARTFMIVCAVLFFAGAGYVWQFSAELGNEYSILPSANREEVLFGPPAFSQGFEGCSSDEMCGSEQVCCRYLIPDSEIHFMSRAVQACTLVEDCLNIGGR